MFKWLLSLLGLRCSHPFTYRERRPMHGLQVLGLHCERCDDWKPMGLEITEKRQRLERRLAVARRDIRKAKKPVKAKIVRIS